MNPPRPDSGPTARSGVILGYDPGGNGSHGVALLSIREGVPTSLTAMTLGTAEDVLILLASCGPVLACGIDTLTCWSTGKSGWRPADRWLRKQYPGVWLSLVSPNSLFGSMALNGMAVIWAARQASPGLPITETHPKVLYWHYARKKYDYVENKAAMDALLSQLLGLSAVPANEHEWDAGLSAFAAFAGLTNLWTEDLHTLRPEPEERIISPGGTTHYFWPT